MVKDTTDVKALSDQQVADVEVIIKELFEENKEAKAESMNIKVIENNVINDKNNTKTVFK